MVVLGKVKRVEMGKMFQRKNIQLHNYKGDYSTPSEHSGNHLHSITVNFSTANSVIAM